MSISPEIFPAYNPTELAESIILRYDEDVKTLKRKATPGGEIVEEYDDDFDGHVVVTEEEAQLSNEQGTAQEALADLSAYIEKPNAENLAYLKKDVGGLKTPLTERTIRKLTEKYGKNSSAYRTATHKGRLVNTPDEVWTQAIQIVRKKLEGYAEMGLMEDELRRPTEFTYVGTLVVHGEVSKFMEAERKGAERELREVEKLLESPPLARLISIDYIGYVDFMIEKLQGKPPYNLLFLSTPHVIHAISGNDSQTKLRFYAKSVPQFVFDEDTKEGVIKEDIASTKRMYDAQAKELISYGFEVKEVDEAKSGELPTDMQHFVEDPLKPYEVFEKLGISLE